MDVRRTAGQKARDSPTWEGSTPVGNHATKQSTGRHRKADMNESALKHLVCPDTLEPLHLETAEASDETTLNGRLIGPVTAYPVHDGVPSFLPSDTAESQTVESFAQKWSAHRYYRTHTGEFYTEWFLQRYGLFDLSKLREFLEGMEFVLDAGTGSGRDAANFAHHSTATVFAADIACEALEVARQDVKHPRVCFVHADINRLPFPDAFFDFINCDQVIHHTPDPRATFEALRRKLKPGGRICCYVYRKKAVMHLLL